MERHMSCHCEDLSMQEFHGAAFGPIFFSTGALTPLTPAE